MDEVGCSMLVRFSGSTPSLDHSFDGISIGISLDHTLVISFWYVLLVEPSSCNLHEGTLVFLIQGGFSNRSPRLAFLSNFWKPLSGRGDRSPSRYPLQKKDTQDMKK